MKPIKLTMSAFGPYSKETVIDFENDIGNDGIFLISGDTGCGKTTIFDAMSYCLYGEASGGNARRQIKYLRSDYASPETETFVEFTFLHKGKTYTVRRSPEYMRPKKSGMGLTKHVATATFLCEDTGEVENKIEAINGRVEDLLGLTREQFSQTVMIAQGDFLKIINASSKDRKDLFQKIFNTKIYSDLQLKLKAMNDKCADDLYDIDRDVKSNMDRIILDDECENITILQTYLEDAKYLDKLIPEFDKYLETKEEEHKKELKEKIESDKKYVDLNKKYTEAEGINNDFKLRDQLILDQTEHLKKEDEIKNKTALLASARKAQSLAADERVLDNKRKDLKNLQDSLKENKDKKTELEKSFKEAETTLTKLQKEQSKIDADSKRADSLKDTLDIISKRDADKKNLDDLLEKQKNQFALSTEANETYNKVKDNFYASQNGLIAKELEKGKPCPVCGSKEHPAPAKLPKVSATKGELDKAEKVRDAEDKKLKEIDTDVEKAKTTIKETNKRLLELKLSDSVTAKDVKKEIAELNDKIDKFNTDKKTAEKNKEYFDKELSAVKALIKSEESDIKAGKEDITNLEKTFNKNLKAQGFATFEEYEAAKLQDDEIEDMDEYISTYQMKKTSLADQIAAYKDKLKGKKLTNLDALKEETLEAKAIRDNIDSLEARHSKDLDTNKTAQAEFKKLQAKRQKLGERYAVVDSLYKVVSGQVRQTVRIPFETYVQQYYFKQVIAAANKRLTVLTDGMFTLRCKEEAKNLRSQAGLDLDVLDRSTGIWRDVSTLSGGESFMASMALALGLSDTVQSNSGEIRLDSMFIDEGFGSLDENSLRQAVELLLKLADGNRLIGVISHMPELKEEIDKKVIITKKLTGSEITIE